MSKTKQPFEPRTIDEIRELVDNIRACTDITYGPAILDSLDVLGSVFEIYRSESFEYAIAYIEDDPFFPEYALILKRKFLLKEIRTDDEYMRKYIESIESANAYFSPRARALFFQRTDGKTI